MKRIQNRTVSDAASTDNPTKRREGLRMFSALTLRFGLSLLIGLDTLTLGIALGFLPDHAFVERSDVFESALRELHTRFTQPILLFAFVLFVYFLVSKFPWRKPAACAYVLCLVTNNFISTSVSFANAVFRPRRRALMNSEACPSVDEVIDGIGLAKKVFGVPLFHLMQWRSSAWLLVLYSFVWALGTTALLLLAWDLLKRLLRHLRSWQAGADSASSSS